VDLPSQSNSSEWNLVLLASSPSPCERERLQGLLQQPIDWDCVSHLADHHGTSCLLYRHLTSFEEVVPAAPLAALREKCDRNIHRSLFLTREMVGVLECIEQLGVEAIAYKGIVLSEVYYGDIALRQAGDMDFFVRAADVGKIKNAVRDLGYTTRVAIPENAEADYIASGYEATFDSAAGKNLLELQWALQPRFYAVDYDMEGLFQRSVIARVAGRWVKTPSPEDLLIVLSVHAAKHLWGRLIWLCDIAQILKRDQLEWDWIQAQAQALGIERILHITLLLTNRLLGPDIPATVASAVGREEAAQALAKEIALSVAAGVSYEEEKLSYFRMMTRLRERRIDRWRFWSRLAFTPGPGEWAAVKLPRPLFPLYRFVRLARLAARFTR
jgi:hypothetical protein